MLETEKRFCFALTDAFWFGSLSVSVCVCASFALPTFSCGFVHANVAYHMCTFLIQFDAMNILLF